MDRLLYVCAGALGAAGFVLGAIAGHGLEARVGPRMHAIFETAVRYQMYHVFAIFAAAWAWSRWRSKPFALAGGLFVTGILIFCGSLYVLALSGIRWLGVLTPVGGIAFLAGWLCLTWGAIRAREVRP